MGSGVVVVYMEEDDFTERNVFCLVPAIGRGWLHERQRTMTRGPPVPVPPRPFRPMPEAVLPKLLPLPLKAPAIARLPPHINTTTPNNSQH